MATKAKKEKETTGPKMPPPPPPRLPVVFRATTTTCAPETEETEAPGCLELTLVSRDGWLADWRNASLTGFVLAPEKHLLRV